MISFYAESPINGNLYHYAGNNPVKYVDPTGLHLDDWQDNGDGTWTVKSEGATLWDVYGADWKEKSGYDGDPTKLQVGDTVGKKEVGSILPQFDFISTSVDIFTGIAEYKATVPEFTKATPKFLPFPVLKNPDLITSYKKLHVLSKSLLFISIGLDITDGIYAGIKYDSYARGTYRIVTNLATTGIAAGGSYLGAALGTCVEPVGGTIVGGLIGGAIFGYGSNYFFSKVETYLFEGKTK